MTPSAHVDTFTRDHLPPIEEWPLVEFTIDSVQYPERLNAATELITRQVVEVGADAPAFLTPDGAVWTYGDVLAHADEIAHVLTRDLGLVPGNRVILRGPNTPWLAACWLAVLKAGLVAVTIMPVLREQEVAELVGLTRPSAMLVDSRFDDLGSAITMPTLRFGIDDMDAFDPSSLSARAAVHRGRVFEDVDTAADDVALLGPTSGSTGVPKITMHFHRDILANADTFARHLLAPTSADVFAGSAPLAFTFGLGGLVVFPLRFGASALMTERVSPAELAELVERFGVSVLFTAPTAYRAIIRSGRPAALRGLRAAVSAGEHLPASLWHEIKDATGLELINGIGSTELLHIFCAEAGEQIRPGSTGRAVPGYRLRVIDQEGCDVAPGELGHLAVVGPTGCRYLSDPRQRTYVQAGWNVTGDVFSIDEDGHLWYVSRSDDLIVTSGINVGAPEVEAVLDLHPDVVECAVIGEPDEARGSIVVAHVVLQDGLTGDDEMCAVLQRFVRSTLAPYKVPREIHFVNQLPRNPSGKLQRFRLQKEFS